MSQPRVEAQAVSQILQMRLGSLLDAVEFIDVDVQTDLSQIIQGEANSVSVEGQGLVMQKDIRIQNMELQTDNIAINPLSAIVGKIKLDQPVNTTVRVRLTEADINQALNSDYIKSKLFPIQLSVDDEIVTLELQLPLSLHLPGGEKMEFTGSMLVHKIDNTQQIGFSGVALPRTDKHPVLLEEFRCTPGTGISLGLTLALMQKVKELMNLPYFEFPELAFCIKELDVQEGTMTLIIEAHVYEIPSS